VKSQSCNFYLEIGWPHVIPSCQLIALNIHETLYTLVYTQEYPITLSMFGIGQMSRLFTYSVMFSEAIFVYTPANKVVTGFIGITQFMAFEYEYKIILVKGDN